MLRVRLLIVVVGAVMLAGAGQAAAATITVNTTNDDQSQGDGQCSLRKAIQDVDSPGSSQTDCAAAAFGANTIVLGSGSYLLGYGGSTLTVDSTVTRLTIVGVGDGKTFIDASLLGNRAFDIDGGASVTLTGLTVANAHAPDGSAGLGPDGSGTAGADGGAILNQGALTLTDAAISNSRAGSGGGGGTPASGSGDAGGDGGPGGSGGAIYNTGTLTLNGVTIGGNSAGNGGQGLPGAQGATGGGGGNGGAGGVAGGIDNAGGSVTIIDSTLRGNSGGAGGGGASGGSGTSAAGGDGGAGGAGGAGGGLLTGAGTVSVTNATFASNAAGGGGTGGPGGVGATSGGGGDGGAGGSGGAIAASDPAGASMLNVTVAGNSSGAGGSGGAATGTPAGTAGAAGGPGVGGGVFDQGSATTVQNSLLALNSGGNCSGSILDGGHNLSFGDASCPAGFASGDPNLGALQNNGGPAPTISLGPGSAAIDQIPPSGAGCPATDERGVPRPSGPKCDIGAYEVAPPVAKTDPATKVTNTAATLVATVTPNAGSATVYFNYGKTLKYGSHTGAQQLGGALATQFTAAIGKLKPNTTYHYQVVVVAMDGTSRGADGTFKTSLAPAIRHLQIRPAAYHASAGTTISYSDSRAATTTLAFLRCTRTKGRRCTRYSGVGKLNHNDKRGRNKVRFSGRLGGRRLRSGSYLLEATARAGGKVGSTVTATFRILG